MRITLIAFRRHTIQKTRLQFLYLLVIFCLLISCDTGERAPEATGIASPEAVARSLSTVDPEQSLHLFKYDRQAPLDIQEDRRWHEGKTTWIDFTYASPKGGRVPARLVIPDGKGPFPGIILQHGGPGTLEDMIDFARAFANYGAVTIMITSPYRRPGGWEITQYMGNTWPIFTKRDLEIKIQTINDLQRAVDILQERPEVDAQRLAYFGISWGGSMGGLLAGVEDRLLAYVLAVGDGGLVEHTSDPGEDGINIHFSENWAAQMWPTEPLHFIGRAAPAALLFQNGLHDTFVPPHDALRYYTAASEPKTIIWYDADHNLPWSFVGDAAKWLQPYLGDRLLFTAPNYRPTAAILERTMIAAVLITLAIFLLEIVHRKSSTWGEGLIWLLGTIPLGPVSLILYWFRPKDVSAPSRWRQVFGIATLMTITLTIGLFLGNRLSLAIANADFRLRFVQLYLTIQIFSWFLNLLARQRYRASTCAQLVGLNLFWVIVMLFPTWLGGFYNPPIWLLYIPEALLGMLISYPLHTLMMRYGYERWTPSGEIETKPGKAGLLVMVCLILFSFLVVLWSVILVVQIYSGLSWREVLRVLVAQSPY